MQNSYFIRGDSDFTIHAQRRNDLRFDEDIQHPTKDRWNDHIRAADSVPQVLEDDKTSGDKIIVILSYKTIDNVIHKKKKLYF